MRHALFYSLPSHTLLLKEKCIIVIVWVIVQHEQTIYHCTHFIPELFSCVVKLQPQQLVSCMLFYSLINWYIFYILAGFWRSSWELTSSALRSLLLVVSPTNELQKIVCLTLRQPVRALLSCLQHLTQLWTWQANILVSGSTTLIYTYHVRCWPDKYHQPELSLKSVKVV